MQPYFSRLQLLQKQLNPDQSLLLTHPSDLLYFTGFQAVTTTEREAFLIVANNHIELFAAAFSPLPDYMTSQTDTTPLPFKITRSIQLTKIAAILLTVKPKEVLLDADSIFLAEANELQKLCTAHATPPLNFLDLDRTQIWKQRIKKDSSEIELMTKAARLTQEVLEQVLNTLQEGETEREIAFRIESSFRQMGADGPAFPTIVAFDDHATLPHYQPGSTKLEKETAILIDCGAKVNGYNGDMTRTVWYGEAPTQEFQAVKQVVEQAYRIGVNILKKHLSTGQTVTASEVDQAVRGYISEQGYGQYFIHTTGHGIGLDVHEPPSVYQTNTTALAPGMIITIEPGVYVPNKVGYRYENTLLITGDGVQELTQ